MQTKRSQILEILKANEKLKSKKRNHQLSKTTTQRSRKKFESRKRNKKSGKNFPKSTFVENNRWKTDGKTFQKSLNSSRKKNTFKYTKTLL